ncbi:hypothetical protein ACWFZ6_07970 [Methylorubrum extorquens]
MGEVGATLALRVERYGSFSEPRTLCDIGQADKMVGLDPNNAGASGLNARDCATYRIIERFRITGKVEQYQTLLK